MNYISAIVIDFGSTNSGCARIEFENGQISYRQPIFIQGSHTYSKDDTWFYVSPFFWNEIQTRYNQLADEDFKIKSRALPYTDSPNIVWGREHIAAFADTIETEKWIGFKYFKMNLYRNEDVITQGKMIPIRDVIRLFLRVLKIECLDFEKGRRLRTVDAKEIQWGITIPTIWGDRERKMMTEVSSEVFGNHIRILSEPEGPILAALLHSSGKGMFSLKKGRTSLVVDIGGGTTDITLLEEVTENPESEYPLRVIASTDGVGVGGNNIDDAYWNYILRLLSKGKKSDDGKICYDSLCNEELKEVLLKPFVENLKGYIEMENAWLRVKHGQSECIQFPPQYLKWLKNVGHGQVADTLTNIVIGVSDIDMDELRKKVFSPVFDVIGQKVKSFLVNNYTKMPNDAELSMVIKAGGLSLSKELCNIIDSQVNNLNLKFTSASLAADPVKTSGCIMDGALIVLVNRKIINRKAPYNIFYDLVINLFSLRDIYKSMGIEISVGELNDMYERDVKLGAQTFCKAVPVAIKNMYFKDYKGSFSTLRSNQEVISICFYGSDNGFVVLPIDNSYSKLIGEQNFSTRGYSSFNLVIDFNEFPINNNFHYFITSVETGETIAEDNIYIKPIQ